MFLIVKKVKLHFHEINIKSRFSQENTEKSRQKFNSLLPLQNNDLAIKPEV